jgi:hypothetical protein
MSIEVQHRRGTTAQHATFTGAEGEVTVDTDKDTLVVHDGVTAGGHPLVKVSDLKNTRAIAFYIDGTLAVETGAMSIIAPFDGTITEVRLAVDAAPTGADLIIDLNKNGTTLYTTQANRPTIAADNTAATAIDPDVTAFFTGDKISLDIDQIGSTGAGENLAVTIICEAV